MDDNRSEFIIELRENFSSLDTLALRLIAENIEIIPDPFLSEIYRYCLTDTDDRIKIVEFLDRHLNIFEDDARSNLIALGLVDSIQSDEELIDITRNCDNCRNILCQHYI